MIVALACLVGYGLVGWIVSDVFADKRSENASAFEAEGDYISADFALDIAPYLDAAVWPLALVVRIAEWVR